MFLSIWDAALRDKVDTRFYNVTVMGIKGTV